MFNEIVGTIRWGLFMAMANYFDLTRLASLVGLALSAALLGFYVAPHSGLCGYESNCSEVVHSGYGRVLDIPLPLIGLLGFAALLLTSLSSNARCQRAMPILAGAAGIVGAALLFVQFAVIGRWCRFCLIADISAIVVAISELGLRLRRPRLPTAAIGRLLWGVSGVFSVCLGFVLVAVSNGAGRDASSGTPLEVTSRWVEGKVNVVEVSDFECPECRKMHAIVAQMLREKASSVNLVRLTAPMPAHRQARSASRAFLCAERLGKGAEMAEALFVAKDLSPKNCSLLAQRMGITREKFAAGLSDLALDEQLDANIHWVRQASPRGLPVIWVQDRVFFGVQSIEKLHEVVQEAERQIRSTSAQ